MYDDHNTDFHTFQPPALWTVRVVTGFFPFFQSPVLALNYYCEAGTLLPKLAGGRFQTLSRAILPAVYFICEQYMLQKIFIIR